MSGAVRRRAVKVRDTNRDRLRAALEIRSYRSGKDAELVLFRRLDADDCAASEHIRTDIQCSAAAIRSDPCRIGADNFLDCFDPLVHRIDRHLQTLAGILHALCVEVRTERDDVSVFCRVSLQTLETGLGILQDACTLGDDDLVIVCQDTFIPCSILEVGNETIVCLLVTESQRRPVDILLLYHIFAAFLYCFTVKITFFEFITTVFSSQYISPRLRRTSVSSIFLRLDIR